MSDLIARESVLVAIMISILAFKSHQEDDKIQAGKFWLLRVAEVPKRLLDY